jgi:hypothetical protein
MKALLSPDGQTLDRVQGASAFGRMQKAGIPVNIVQDPSRYIDVVDQGNKW